MITLKQATPLRSDCTAGYFVILDKDYTVAEFITEVLTREEWGYIGIYKEGQKWFEPGELYCEYRGNKMVAEMQGAVLTRKIRSVTASGGYTRMDYLIKL